MSHEGASRPRKERSSMGSGAWQQTSLSETTGAGQSTDSSSRATNAVEARRRLVSIDIEPFPDHADRLDLAVTGQRRCDLVGVGAARGDDGRTSEVLRAGVVHMLEVMRKVAAPE